MRDFILVLRNNLYTSLSLNKLRKKNNLNKYSFLKILGVIAFFALMVFTSFFYLFTFAGAFYEVGKIELILKIGLFGSVFMSLLMTITSSNHTLFKSKDFDFLMSLPVKTSKIVLVKFINLMIINYILFAFIYLPSLIIYTIYVKTTLVFWLLALIVFILGPLLPSSIAVVLGYVSHTIIPEYKYKNIIVIVGSIFALVLFMLISFTSSFAVENPELFISGIEKVTNYLPNFAYYGLLGNYYKFVFFVLLALIPFVLLNLVLGKLFLKANTKTKKRIVNTKTVKEAGVNTPKQALIKKEIKKYFSSPVYVLNTLVGPLLSIIMIILLSVASFSQDVEMPEEINSVLPLVFIGAMIFLLGITSTTSSSISLEGKSIWILKVAPIKTEDIFQSKIFINLLITIPFVVVGTIILMFLQNFSFIDLLGILLIPSLFVVFMSNMGLYFNIIFPRFDHDNDAKAIKQSMSVFMTMLVGMGLAIATSIGIGIIYMFLNNILGILFGIGFTFLLALLSHLLLYKNGVKRFSRLIV